MPVIQFPEDLPISARREEILQAVRTHQVVVIAGETGSGKTTQLPKICLAAGLAERGKIGCTQPRRVAAMSVSRRVAEELKVPWGREVGCKMRFNDDTSRETRIKFMTDGILLAEIQSDPLLRGYSTLIIDEAHERSLNIDFLLGYLQGLLKKRPDLKLIITSATIDTQAFSRAFGNAPIIEVSGRLYPVEIRYAPPEAHANAEESADEVDHVEAAVRATEDALIESDFGDILVFMPTERDIRETRDALEKNLGSGIEVLGLFGRMPAAEQQRIFEPGSRRRVVVATNIAETSITLPRIRYVVDAGLSRISRYNPRTRTKRLPVEEIAQSSANQRAGRAGRVQDGICIRLYSQEDFEKRPKFTQPEIQRANLAEVILRMKAFRLGDIESFPFVDPPQQSAIRAGYQLLYELGALTETHELTDLGRELAHLPIDPTLGRMLLQARVEDSLPELLVIAAGLSVPDPRERPEDQKDAAATAHKAFADPDSDFLMLLNIWREAPWGSSRGTASGNSLRCFCKANFLSVARMREWREIYHQLADAVEDEVPRQRRQPSPQPPVQKAQAPAPNQARSKSSQQPESHDEVSYRAVHRAILTGLLGHVAQRHEKNLYKAAGNRQVTLFPGSNLYARPQPKKGPKAAANPGEKTGQPGWIIAAEIVETSQLFARTIGAIDPEWVVELGEHLCKFRYTEPHWSAKAGRVLVTERVLIHGLELSRRYVDFGRIEPEAATEIFIRSALVAADARIPLKFFEHNQRLREKVENALTRARSRQTFDLDQALFRFYATHIRNVSSIHDLNKLVRERIASEPEFLCVRESDLIGESEATYDRALFPDQVKLANTVLPVSYAYDPGAETDGVTLQVPLPVAQQLTTAEVQWAVPGIREELIGVLLRALPKSVRKGLMPLEPKIREIVAEFSPGRGDFIAAFAAFLTRKYREHVRPEDWPPNPIPEHLRPRVEVLHGTKQALAAGRDLHALQADVKTREVRSDSWSKAEQQWVQSGLTTWSFGNLPESVVVEKVGSSALLGYLGLQVAGEHVEIRLFRTSEEAGEKSAVAVRRLAERALATDLNRVRKDIAGFVRAIPAAPKAVSFQNALQQLSAKLTTAPTPAFSAEVLQSTAYEHLLGHALQFTPVFPLTEARYKAWLQQTRAALPGLTYQFGDWLKRILTIRAELLASGKRYQGFDQDLQRLVPADFLAKTPHPRLPHLYRYLRAMQVRAERASASPAKDAEKARQVACFTSGEKVVKSEHRERFRWLLEEYRVSLFAQELGTAEPVSAQRLDALLK